MSDTIIDSRFSSNYSLLPDKIKFFLSSELSGRVAVDLAEKYKTEKRDVYSLIFLAVNSDFNLSLVKKKLSTFNLTGINLDKFWLDLLGSFFLPISESIKKYTKNEVDILESIKKLGANPNSYRSYVDNFNEEVVSHEESLARSFIENYKDKFDIKEESDYILDIFSNDVIEMLTTNSFSASTSLNVGIIYLLMEDETFKDKALRSLFVNSERLGMSNILIDEKKVEPTIANWLKDFIKINGSGTFNDIVLIDYINNSINAKMLSSDNKNTLANILRFYRNLSFFPDSLENIDIAKWKIFPFSDPDNENEKKANLDEERKRTIKNIDILEEERGFNPPHSAEERESEEVLRLRRMLDSYAPSSLERKAINEEIRKIKKQEEK